MTARVIDLWTGLLIGLSFVLASTLFAALYADRGFAWPALGVFIPSLTGLAIWAWIGVTVRHYPRMRAASSVQEHLRLTQILVAGLCVVPVAEDLIARAHIGWWRYGLLGTVLGGAALAFIGNRFGKLRRNPTVGVRNAWTFFDDEVWLRTHRLAGRVQVVGGLAIVVTALVQPEHSRWVIGVAALVVVAALGVRLYSFREFRKRQSSRRDR